MFLVVLESWKGRIEVTASFDALQRALALTVQLSVSVILYAGHHRRTISGYRIFIFNGMDCRLVTDTRNS